MTLNLEKKNLLSLLLASLLLFSLVLGTTNAQAATTSGLDLSKGETSASTARVTVKSGQSLFVGIYYYANAPSKSTTYKIFKNGSLWYTGTISGTTRSVEKTFNPGAGEYSVRHYNTTAKDVSSYGGIQVR